MINDVHQAEDLTQETFIKAYRYLDLESEVNYPKTFLYRIAHNLTVDHVRKKAPIYMVKELFSSKKDSSQSIESVIQIREDSKVLYESLQLLKPSYRQVIILRKIEEFSIQETAQILNWSISKVKSTLYRALRALEDQLNRRGFIYETL